MMMNQTTLKIHGDSKSAIADAKARSAKGIFIARGYITIAAIGDKDELPTLPNGVQWHEMSEVELAAIDFSRAPDEIIRSYQALAEAKSK